MACDPYFSQVVLLLNMAGTNGSSTFLDTSPVGNTMSANNATIDTGNQIGGLNCADIAATTSPPPYSQITCPITLGSSLDFFSTGADFTIEGYFYIPGTNSACALIDFGGNGTDWGITALALSGAVDIRGPQTLGWTGINTPGSAYTLQTWTHFAIQRASGVGSLYVGGVLYGTQANWNTKLNPYAGALVRVGAVSASLTNSSQNVSMADIRVTYGRARYSGSSFVPAVPLVANQCSVPQNLVGDTLAQATAANTAAGYFTAVQQQNHPTFPNGVVIAQSPPFGFPLQPGGVITVTLSLGPATTTGMGGDVWGSTGGGQYVPQSQTPIGQALAYATQPTNAVVQGSQSVLASLSTGAVSPATAAAVTQNTPASQVPTAPTMG